MDSVGRYSALAEAGPHWALGSISPVTPSVLLGASCAAKGAPPEPSPSFYDEVAGLLPSRFNHYLPSSWTQDTCGSAGSFVGVLSNFIDFCMGVLYRRP